MGTSGADVAAEAEDAKYKAAAAAAASSKQKSIKQQQQQAAAAAARTSIGSNGKIHDRLRGERRWDAKCAVKRGKVTVEKPTSRIPLWDRDRLINNNRDARRSVATGDNSRRHNMTVA